ncbi:DUF2382 domain-containing protein [Glutamicibacter protophormiae]|uniref:Uncharacterized protein (TIGR02271 family) n=1 Tax=Glutamicibacter protophormiae TaxID=37930 RepID=A0ABS4XSV9_GLUPR|nr:PRC and DUF2382 domain-containing protein [Glutamicibacter protophormiae]MBP2399342.1 uncharacterized protein (TIGR02271 family) [Glutamicibacter protophormiae]GGL85598.1 photosystem reaction center subunit H [Glutamicibacter protophormiae]
MIDKHQIDALLHHDGTVVGADGEKIGKFGQVFLDDQTGEPQWVTVRTGLFGLSESFVPLDEARMDGDTVIVPFDKQTVKGAPRIDDEDGHLSPADEQELYRYYNRAYDATAPEGIEADRGTGMDRESGVDRTAAGPLDGGLGTLAPGDNAGVEDELDPVRGQDKPLDGQGADQSMTRSEEQLRVGTESVETGRVRLRKYVVTEDVTTTVPVSHEEVRVEREPLAGDAAGEPELGEQEEEVTLHAERPVVEKEAVPVEKVRLGTETVTEDEQVTERLRKEEVETEGDSGRVDPVNRDRSRDDGI